MAQRIDATALSSTVSGLLDKFGQAAENVMAEAVWDTAGEAVKELKKGGGFKGTGEYNKGWARKLTKKRLYATALIYNKEHGELTHLLEFGHALRNGGRARSFPHIAPVNDRVEEIFVDKFTNLLAEALINGKV